MYQDILYEVEDPVATITLNRPEQLNAFTRQTMLEIRQAANEAEHDDKVVAIVITGRGRGFCAGLDLRWQSANPDWGKGAEVENAIASYPDMRVGGHWIFAYLLALRKPVIAAINGAAAGGGLSLAMSCDLRFMADDAFMVTSFAQRGMAAEHGLSWILPRLIGQARALEILWSGRRVDAYEAVRIGLANRAVSADGLLEDAKEFVRALGRTTSPNSIMLMKQQVYRDQTSTLHSALEGVAQLSASLSGGLESQEGWNAFLERRQPNFARISG